MTTTSDLANSGLVRPDLSRPRIDLDTQTQFRFDTSPLEAASSAVLPVTGASGLTIPAPLGSNSGTSGDGLSGLSGISLSPEANGTAIAAQADESSATSGDQPAPNPPARPQIDIRANSGEDRRFDGELTAAEEAEVRELQAIDRQVRAHEAAHARAGGNLASAPEYEFVTGPDGRRYAVAGRVQITTPGEEVSPSERIEDLERVISAALAPAQPSPQDRAVAAEARVALNEARAEEEEAAAEAAQAAEEEANNDTSDAPAQAGTNTENRSGIVPDDLGGDDTATGLFALNEVDFNTVNSAASRGSASVDRSEAPLASALEDFGNSPRLDIVA